MIALAVVSGLGLSGIIMFATWTVIATRKASSLDLALCKAELQVRLLEDDLLASRRRRTDLAEALKAQEVQALKLEEDLDAVATYLPVELLDRLRADVDGMLSFAKADDADREAVPSVGADVPGELGGEPPL